MKLDFCAVCGVKENLMQHHIEPVVFTRIKRRANRKQYDDNKALRDCSSYEIFAYLFDQGAMSDDGELTLCSMHHGLVHGLFRFQKYEHRRLISEGVKRAVANGAKLGRKRKIDLAADAVIELRKQGLSLRKIAAQVNLSTASVARIIWGRQDSTEVNATK